MNRRVLFFLALGLALLLSLPALLQRWQEEGDHMQVAVVADLKDLREMGSEEGLSLPETYRKLEDAGLEGLNVYELTGRELQRGALPIRFDPYSRVAPALPDHEQPGMSDRAVVTVPEETEALLPQVRRYLEMKFPALRELPFEGGQAFILPFSYRMLLEAGVLPDIAGLRQCADLDVPVIYRPMQTAGVPTDAVVRQIRDLCNRYEGIRCLAPAGAVAAGYPHAAALGRMAGEIGVAVAGVEFSRQWGANSLVWSGYPRVLPLHSVTEEEVLSRRLGRRDLVERMIRAARERSVRLLLMRPYAIASGERLDRFAEDIAAVTGELEAGGYVSAWPETLQDRSTSLLAAVALAVVLIFCSMEYLWRNAMTEREPLQIGGFVVLLVIAAGLGLAVYNNSQAAKLVGALATALVAAEAALFALDGWRRPTLALSMAMVVLLVGGCTVAAFFGVPEYMLRLRTFSGVKLTLLLPPLLVLFSDLKRRIHPESLGHVLSRPPVWGEFVLLGALLGGVAFLVLRSGNVSLVPGWEVTVREKLEQLLVARPRNKELFLGYPALVLWYLFRRKDLWPRYREVFRVVSVFAFASAVNSFCHFHTPLYFTLWRVGNGVVSGVLLGLLLAAVLWWIALPLWRRWQRPILN